MTGVQTAARTPPGPFQRRLGRQRLGTGLKRTQAVAAGEGALDLNVVSVAGGLTISDRSMPALVVASTADLPPELLDDPSITVVPYLSTGATDSADLRRAGIKAYGLLPFPLEMPDEEKMHGNDERLPLAAFGFGIRFVTGIAEALALR